MTLHLGRRSILLLPLLAASCADDTRTLPARGDFTPLRFGYLPPISLNVERVEMAGDFMPPSGDTEVSGQSPVSLPDTLYALARDRLKPVASGGVATVRILAATITRRRDALVGMLAIRLDVHDQEETNSGFAEARVTATKTGPATNLRAAIYDIVKSMMDDMNVELEYQLRHKLRAWVVEPPVPSVVEPAGKLPPPPPAPPRT